MKGARLRPPLLSILEIWNYSVKAAGPGQLEAAIQALVLSGLF
jgi:hypothetical protein